MLKEVDSDIFFSLYLHLGHDALQRMHWGSVCKQRSLKVVAALNSSGISESVVPELDDCMSVLFRLIGADMLIVLLNCVLLEQSVVFVGPPGSEELLSKCVLGLVDFCCGHVSEYIYVPLVCSSVAKYITGRVSAENGCDARERRSRFIVGAYYGDLDVPVDFGRRTFDSFYPWETLSAATRPRNSKGFSDKVELYTKKISDISDDEVSTQRDRRARNSVARFACSFDDHNVTVVDILRGTMWPGKLMHFAAGATVHEWVNGVTTNRIDGRMTQISKLLSNLQLLNPDVSVDSYLPPFPPKHRDILRSFSLQSTKQSLKGISDKGTPVESKGAVAFFANIHTAISDLIHSVPLFCKMATVYDDGYVCECLEPDVLSSASDDFETVPTLILRTAVKSIFNTFDVDHDDNERIHSTMGSYGHCSQYTGPGLLSLISKCCSGRGVTFKRSLGQINRTVDPSIFGRGCHCCESLGDSLVPSRKVCCTVLLFDNDAFLEHSVESRSFLLKYTTLRSFERLVVACMLGETRATNIFHPDMNTSRSQLADNGYDSVRNLTPTGSFYPSRYLRVRLSPKITCCEKFKYARIAGYLFVCIVRVVPATKQAVKRIKPLTHTLPVEVIASSNSQMGGTAGSAIYDVELEDDSTPSNDNEYGLSLGTIELSKFKRRWCVLDGYRFSYYKHKSESTIKGSVVLNAELNGRSDDANRASILTPTHDKQRRFEEKTAAIPTVPPVFGIDYRAVATDGAAAETKNDCCERKLTLLYSPGAPYLAAGTSTAPIPDITGSAVNTRSAADAEPCLYSEFDDDTNKWLTALSARLIPYSN